MGTSGTNSARSGYADFFDFAPITYALLDAVGLVVKVNLAGCRLLGVQRAQLVGRPLQSFVVPQDRNEILDHLHRCRSAVAVVESDVRFSARNGPVVTCRLHSTRATDGGRDVFPTVIVDQREHLALDGARLVAERQREEAERGAKVAMSADATKYRFLAMVSHELRTPLTPALMAASRLAMIAQLPEEISALAAIIRRNVELEARLIDDLLNVARINQGRISLQLEPIDVHDVLREAVEICRAFAEVRNVTVTLNLMAPSHHVKADRARLQQVFWNLLNNSIKFTRPGGAVAIGSGNVSEETIRVSVHDNGIGMDDTVLESLFAPFEHKAATDESRSGLGLGLSICKGIVGAHDGQIWATSEGPGRGSLFAVELTTVEPDPDAAETSTVERGRSLEPSNAPASTRVLVIEDDVDSGEMLSLFLFHHGFEVEVASSLAEGLSKLEERWDVVMSDIGLPDGSGLEVARRARHIPNRPEKLIALTGYGASHDIEASRLAGFDDHIVKPIDLEKLMIMLGQARRGANRLLL